MVLLLFTFVPFFQLLNMTAYIFRSHGKEKREKYKRQLNWIHDCKYSIVKLVFSWNFRRGWYTYLPTYLPERKGIHFLLFTSLSLNFLVWFFTTTCYNGVRVIYFNAWWCAHTRISLVLLLFTFFFFHLFDLFVLFFSGISNDFYDYLYTRGSPISMTLFHTFHTCFDLIKQKWKKNTATQPFSLFFAGKSFVQWCKIKFFVIFLVLALVGARVNTR